MALRWFDGFDYYSAADLSSQYNIAPYPGWSIVAGAGRFGSGALTHSSGGGGVPLSKFFDSQPTWIVGVAYKFSAAGHPNMVFSLQDSGNAQVELKMNASNQLGVYRNGTLIASGTTSLLANTVYFIEWKVTIATSIAAHSCKVRINGVDELDLSAGSNTNPQATGTANRVVIWWDYFANINTFDDFYVCDGTGGALNDFLGDMRVETEVPNVGGTYAEWSVNTGTHVAAVSESSQDGDTTYLFSSTPNQRETFHFPNLSSVPTSIAGIKLTAVVRKDDAGLRGITPLVRVSGTDYLGAERGLGDSYQYTSQIFTQNPGTSAPWTGSDVNALDIGWKLTT